jgi:hypothetical protein
VTLFATRGEQTFTMALIEFGVTQCPLCSQVISKGDQIVSTSHFIEDEADPLWAYSDAALHRVCFLNWPQRGTFISRFNEVSRTIMSSDGKWQEMDSDGSISVRGP